MPDNHDAILLESVKTHRARLRSAFLFGELTERRVAGDNVKRLVGSIVLAAVACAVCVGVSFVMSVIGDQNPAATGPSAVSSSTGPTPLQAPLPTEEKAP
ncbi:hypothetical protein [Compostimonas suwonensis]|uniref:Uncharacterized protein n=1 Tax=Compostimonas suwonensis TaxID=1048394 RepID=A0A2M9C5B2_9MICO|nr:hypothetical protein [Compostimonas suwonensis]PJJ65702.1 hypothetical protein CLV54_0739 [Compostimonas suwonensis]